MYIYSELQVIKIQDTNYNCNWYDVTGYNITTLKIIDNLYFLTFNWHTHVHSHHHSVYLIKNSEKFNKFNNSNAKIW